MTQPDPTPPTPAEPVALPTDTTPTWEIELLISGALTFAALQLPGLLDTWFFSLVPRMPESLETTVVMGYVFGKGIATLLAVTFSVHILLRGMWAAALGLHSVYPDGILWDRITAGPLGRRLMRDSVVPLPRYIARLDNAASIGFALGGVLLLMTAVSSIGAFTVFGLREVLYRTTGVMIGLLPLSIAVFVPVGLIMTANEVDRRMGGRLRPGSALARWVERLMRFGAGGSLNRLIAPMMLVFTSRTGQLKGTVVLVLMLYGIFGVVLVQALVSLGVVSLDGYRFLGDRGSRVVDPEHYLDQRVGQQRQYSTLPFIPSETVSGGFLRLFVPYRIENYDAAAERTCPEAIARTTDRDTLVARAARDSVVACVGRQLAPQLDSIGLADTRWFAATDPASGLRGLMAQVPIAALPDGPHLLSIARLPRRRVLAEAAAEKRPVPAERYAIPFWIDRTGSGR